MMMIKLRWKERNRKNEIFKLTFMLHFLDCTGYAQIKILFLHILFYNVQGITEARLHDDRRNQEME
jgi:hypothetical protein